MAKMTVHMLGIMYFDICHTGEPVVVLPDGTQGVGGLDPHFASLFVERARYDWDDWPWPAIVREVPLLTMRGETVSIPVLEFRIPVFSDIDFPPSSDDLDVGDLPQGLESIREADPNFDPDLTGPGAIARTTLGSGQLHACRFNSGATAVQWAIESNEEPLWISARAEDQWGNLITGSIFLKPAPSWNPLGAEVVFANMPDFLTGIVPSTKGHTHGAHNHAGHHFSLYGKIDKNHGSPHYPAYHSDIEYQSGVMAALQYADILSSCGPTCC